MEPVLGALGEQKDQGRVQMTLSQFLSYCIPKPMGSTRRDPRVQRLLTHSERHITSGIALTGCSERIQSRPKVLAQILHGPGSAARPKNNVSRACLGSRPADILGCNYSDLLSLENREAGDNRAIWQVSGAFYPFLIRRLFRQPGLGLENIHEFFDAVLLRAKLLECSQDLAQLRRSLIVSKSINVFVNVLLHLSSPLPGV